MSCCPALTPGPPRVAYAIGRRTGGAVERNRIRRRLRPIVSDHADRLRPDYQYLVGARTEALRTPISELTAAWLGLLDAADKDLS